MGEPALLERGNSYLLVTRRSRERGWHTAASPHGRLLVRGVPGDAPPDEVLNSSHAGGLRDRFTRAVEDEIPFVLPKRPDTGCPAGLSPCSRRG